jgi:hypothetical protein
VNKTYVLSTVKDRAKLLKNRYRLAVNNKDELGMDMKPTVAAVVRSHLKRDYNLCKLVEELTESIIDEKLALSEDALAGLDKLVEPIERHRRLRGSNVRV